MAFPPSLLLAFGVATWALWGFLKWLGTPRPLDVIPGPPPESWLLGNMRKIFDAGGLEYREDLLKRYGRLYRFAGLLQERHLVVSDAKALYHILIKDQDIFEEAEDFITTNYQTFGEGLLSTLGEQHKKQRKMLNPVFSAAHMREMTPVFYEVVHKVESSIAQLVGQGEGEIDFLSWMTRTALELVAQSGFGYSFDTLEPDSPEHPYAASLRNYAGTINDPVVTIVRMLVFPYVHNLGTPGFQRAMVSLVPWKKLHNIRDMVDVMHRTSLDIFDKARLAVINENGHSERIGRGKDIMSALVKANMSASDEDKLTDEELIGQVSAIIFAAMDTTSNGMSKILYLLSEHPAVQDRLRQEVTEAHANHGCDLDYEALNSLPYLDAVCRESLRVYTPIPSMPRQAKRDAMLPLAIPIRLTDGREVSEVFIPKGTVFFISLHDCNRDPAIWGPDAREWKPERWLSPLPASVAEARVPGVYSNIMTFLGGSRSCIGFKFSQLEMKVVLSLLVAKFKFSPSGKDVVWLNHGIVQPVVEDRKRTGSAGRKSVQLPLRVSLNAST